MLPKDNTQAAQAKGAGVFFRPPESVLNLSLDSDGLKKTPAPLALSDP